MSQPASDQHRRRVEEFQKTNQLGLATLFFSDLVGSTQLKQSLGDRAAIHLIQAHHAAYRELLKQFAHAEEIGTAGDSFFLIFAAPSDAVRFALLAQARTHALATESGYPLRDRIGIHVGEVFIKAPSQVGEVKDLLGIQVDTCARIMSLGTGDQILLSRFAFDNARQALRGDSLQDLAELAWLNHGFYEMKGVEEPVEICEVGEVPRATLKAPEAGEKGHRIVTGDEPVLGWRPAAGQFVPNTQWQLERLLGEGGFGEVWLSRHQTLKDRRVLKFCFNAEKARSLKREVTLFRVLREHVGAKPGIVAVHDVYFDQPPYYIVMDHIDGPTLTDWAEAYLPLDNIPLETRLEIIAQIADALQTAHDAGVIHRDVKPSNILITESNGALRAMLTDFGIGQLISGATPAGITQLGFTNTMMAADSITGTQLYLAPELLSGQPATIRSDIYALGIVLYQLAIGSLNRPLTSDWADDIADQLLREDIRNCVAGDPAKRFAGSAQLSAHLRALPRRRTEKESAERQEARAVRRRQQTRFATLAAAVVAIVAIFFAFAFFRERDLKLEVAEESRRAEAGETKAKSTLAELRGTAPTFSAQAKALVEAGKPNDAIAKLGYAIQLDPNNLSYRLQRANLLEASQHLSEATLAYREVLALDSANRSAQENLALCERLQRENGTAPLLRRELQVQLVDALVREGRGIEVGSLAAELGRGGDAIESTLRARLKEYLVQPGWNKDRFQRLANGTFFVNLDRMKLGDLSALRGMPISGLNLSSTDFQDLKFLAGLPLTYLGLTNTQVTDLAPLHGLKLERLNCNGCKVSDIEPLRNMPLRMLDLSNTLVTDLSALSGMPMEDLRLASLSVISLVPLRGLPLRHLTLNFLQGDTDMSNFADCVDLEDIVISKFAANVEKLRGLRKLAQLRMEGYHNVLMPAEMFWAEFKPEMEAVGTISLALKMAGIKTGTGFVDRLPDGTVAVSLRDSIVTDLGFLHGMPVSRLSISGTKVQDLTPLHGLPLRHFFASGTVLPDLEPLRGLPLKEVQLNSAKVASLAPLQDCLDLESIILPPGASDVQALHSLPKLRFISLSWTRQQSGDLPDKTVEQFWKEYDARQAPAKN